MSTDLFGKYFNNPTKSYIYANIQCSNGSSADETSFDFNDSEGQITDNNGVLSSIDLSRIHIGLNQYRTDMRIIEPNGYCYIQGLVFGDSYCSKSFGRILGPITEDSDWELNGMLFFVLKRLCLETGNIKVEFIKVKGDPENEKGFIEVLNDYFESENIPITAKLDDGYIVFTATKLAYEFWIDHVMFWKSTDGTDIFSVIDSWMRLNGKSYDYGWDDGYVVGNKFDGKKKSDEKTVEDDEDDEDDEETPNADKDHLTDPSESIKATNVYSSILKKSDYTRLYNLLNCLDSNFQTLLEAHDVQKIYLYEDLTKYVPAYRYPNGAMIGCLVNVIYPKYNADDITEFEKAVKIAHLVDRVQEFYAIPESLIDGTFTGVRKLVNVSDKFKCEYDTNLYNKWMGYYSHVNVNDDWIEADEIPQVVPEMLRTWENSSVSYSRQAMSIYKDVEHREVMGIEGYCAYLERTGGWMTVGQFYSRFSVPDNPEYPDVKNLVPSFVIYNPNSFPVQVKFMIIA